MNYESGKKLTLLGFGLNILINCAFILLLVVEAFGLYMEGLYILLNCGEKLSLGVAALGFLVMWMCEKKMIDLLTFGAIGVAAGLGLLNYFGVFYAESQLGIIIVTAILSAFYVVLALRAKEFNMFIALLLICAFLFSVFSSTIFVTVLYSGIGLPYFLVWFVWYVGYVVCAGLCFVEAHMEK